MFAKTIIDSDAFLDMPLSTQSLYFHLSMRADDDGFINNPKKIQRMIGATDDDLKLLVAKNFIIPFESGVVVIKHWKIHNYIQSDRYKPTVYTDEKAMLDVKPNRAYTLSDTECIQNGYNMDTQVRLGKDRLDKNRVVEEDSTASASPIRELYPDNLDEILNLWNQQEVTKNIKSMPLMSRRVENTRLCLQYVDSYEAFLDVIRDIDNQGFFREQAGIGKKLRYDWFSDPNNFLKVIEGNYRDTYVSKNLEGMEVI